MNLFLFRTIKAEKKSTKKWENIWKISAKFATFVALSRKKEFIIEMV